MYFMTDNDGVKRHNKERLSSCKLELILNEILQEMALNAKKNILGSETFPFLENGSECTRFFHFLKTSRWLFLILT